MAPIGEVLSKSVKRRECVERSPPVPLITATGGVHESNMFLGRDPTKWYVGEDEPCLKKAAKDCDLGEERCGVKKYIGGDQVKAFLAARSGIVTYLCIGAFGEVKLVREINEGYHAAMKVMTLKGTTEEDLKNVTRESTILKRLRNHPNICQILGSRTDTESQEYQIFIDYYDGGELYDRIEPDIGMPIGDAQRYFQQIIAGVKYMHSVGICHRDIKSENIIFGEDGNLRICDFGLATMFRFNGEERILETSCGSLPYIAPELYSKKYRAQPNDIWACGIILVCMLTGCLPWEEANDSDRDYREWVKDGNTAELAPFNRVELEAFQLLSIILCPDPTKRATIERIENHSWFKSDLSGVTFLMNREKRALGQVNISKKCSKAHLSKVSIEVRDSNEEMETNEPLENESAGRSNFVANSQPTPRGRHSSIQSGSQAVTSTKAPYSFTQPVQNGCELLDYSQISTQQMYVIDPLEKLVQRMTRIKFKMTICQVRKHLELTFNQLKYETKTNAKLMIIVKCSEKPGECSFIVNMMEIPNSPHGEPAVLADFRRSRGDGMVFKRHFLLVKEAVFELLSLDKLLLQ
uniref:Protein kinase domain-containing protein n=1 Tax=Rhabditophanes sp. KR3021 TaxID=114890 RepID=A0AC35TX26_9BILA